MNPLFRDSFPSSGAGGPPATAAEDAGYRRLARAAQEAMREGRIPAHPANQVWGGSGSGGGCAICTRRIERHEMEYELDFADGLDAGSYHVHVACCMAWEAELS